MYSSYFGLNENPFSIAPDPLYLFMSEKHRDALAHLQYGVKTDGGFVLLTGEVGAGKTTLCRSLLEKLPDGVDVAFVLNPKLSVIELLETICDELHISRPDAGSIKQLVDCLNHYLLDSNASGRKTVLIIDEAQNLSIEVLEQLRLLTNLETNRYKLLQIVLLGQPELLQILGRQDMRQLSQRITARFHLGPLAVDEINAYIQHRLKIAGCQRPLFPETLTKTLWQLTDGVPRLINLVCDRALLGAYARELKQVDSVTLRQAASEVFGEVPAPKNGNKSIAATLAVSLVLAVATFGFLSWQNYAAKAEQPIQVEDTPTPPVSAVQVAENSAPSTVEEEVSVEQAEEPSAEEPLSLTWPKGFAMSQSQQNAFSDLAELWGFEPSAVSANYCSFASEQGLDCLARKDSLETLRAINRPAILRLYNDDGSPFHVVMAGLKKERALFVADEQQRELSLQALTSRWFGEYLLLWERPPFKRQLLMPGGTGDAVAWLAESLEALDLYQTTGQEVRLSGELLGAFKRFQVSQGLTPDGVLGPMSQIYINTARDLTGPRLNQQRES